VPTGSSRSASMCNGACSCDCCHLNSTHNKPAALSPEFALVKHRVEYGSAARYDNQLLKEPHAPAA
jgi:hypothetical protein